jgi:hypothetical protein
MKKQFEYKKGIATRIEEEVTLEQVQQAYRDLHIAKRNTLSKAQIYAKLHKQFLGLDKVDLEFKG